MRAIWRICFIILFFFILFFTVDSIDSVAFAYDSYHWDTTTGTVKTSHIITSSNNSQAVIDFEYIYSVNGHTYHSNNINVAGAYFLSSLIGNYFVNNSYFTTNYPPGSKITVYYDPINPSNAAVVKGFTTAHLVDIFLISLTVLSFGASILFYNKNTRISSITDTPEKIIITSILNYSVLVLATIIIWAIIFLYGLGALLINVFAFHGMILFLDALESFIPPILFVIIPTALFLLVLLVEVLILANGFYTIWIKKDGGYQYYTTHHEIVPDDSSESYHLHVEGYYKKLEDRFNFTHEVKRKFKTEEAAENYYQKHIDEPVPTRKTNYQLKNDFQLKTKIPKVFPRLLFISKKGQEDNKLTLGYQTYSNVLLSVLPLLFFISNLYFMLFYEFWSFSSNHLNTNLTFNYSSVNLDKILSSTPLVVFLSVILIFEGFLLLILIIMAVKWSLKKIYFEKILTSHDYWDDYEDKSSS